MEKIYVNGQEFKQPDNVEIAFEHKDDSHKLPQSLKNILNDCCCEIRRSIPDIPENR